MQIESLPYPQPFFSLLDILPSQKYRAQHSFTSKRVRKYSALTPLQEGQAAKKSSLPGAHVCPCENSKASRTMSVT